MIGNLIILFYLLGHEIFKPGILGELFNICRCSFAAIKHFFLKFKYLITLLNV